MRKVFGLTSLIFLICILGTVDHLNAQEIDITSIRLDFRHSLRIPNHFVSVDIQLNGDSAEVSVKSNPLDSTSTKWKSTKINESYSISETEFNEIVDAVQRISCDQIKSNLGYFGNDGTICKITFGNYFSEISYKIWTPNHETKERDLQNFLTACEVVLETGNLNPIKILK